MNRKDHIILLLLAALFCLGVGQTWAQSITVSIDTESTYVPTSIINGSFDDEPWMDFVYGGTTYTFSTKNTSLQDNYITNAIPNGVNGGWNTTETKFYQGSLFEYSANEYNYNTNLSGTTNHFVEMNVYNSAVLYQDLTTHGNDVIRWSLDHVVRTTCGDEIQSLRVEIGAPEYSGTAIVAASGINDAINSHIQSSTKAIFRASGITNPDNATYGFNGSNLEKLSLSQTQSSDNASWHTVTGVYVIPPGQSVTRFGFIAEVASNPGCGNLLDNLTFSTLIGNLSAKQLANGDVELKGYWGETDTSKRLKVVIGSNTYDIDMTSVIGKSFRITIPVEMIGLATSVHVYHQDYENAGRTIEVMSTLDSWPFSYTGTIQTFTAPQTGIYQLRVWGAQGGAFNSSENNGGLGGYATCRTTLTQGEIIYVYVGGQGGGGTKSGPGVGGWNGGGAGGSAFTNYCSSGGGGGATHISKVNNQVIGDGCNFLGGTNYIIVAGGGGGAGHPWTTPGAGGGTEGGKGTRWNSSSQSTYSDYYYYSTSQSCGANGGYSSIADQFDAEGAGGGGAGYYGGTSNYPYGSFPNEHYTDASGSGGNSAYNSSLATDFSTTAGQREGNGQAAIMLLLQGSGTQEEPYLIPSVDAWNFLADQVNAGNTYSGKFFRLTNNISVTTMVGNSESNSFSGTFDGDGNTLTFNKGTAESPFAEYSCAPFRHVKNATITNLHAAGTIYTSAMRAGGLVADSHGALTLAGCRSSVNINSSKSGDGTHGGLVAITTGSSNTVTIGGCVFDGSFATTSSTNSCGGFVGWTGENTPAITNSLMKPGCVAAGMLYNTFARWQSGYEPTITNCYYVATDNLPVDQGTQAYAFATAPANLGSLVQDYDMLKAYANGILYDGIYYVAPIISLTDGDDLSDLATWAGKTCAVTYTRSFTSGKPSTVCLPFAYTKKEGDGSFYAFTGIEKEDGSGEYIATMTDSGESTLTANTPYLYMPSTTGNVDFSGTYTIPAELSAGSTTSGDWTFKGTFATIEWKTAPTTPTYGFSAQDANDGITQGQFVKVGTYVRIKPMRCYLEYNGSDSPFAGTRGTSAEANEQLPETISVRLIGANGDITAIGTLHTKTGEVELDGWYTLDGTRLTGQPTRKGIYVNNGKKVIIK